MPYTKDQLEKGKSLFYNNFREKIRAEYLNRLSGSAENDFRTTENVLLSYERIGEPLEGIETINFDEEQAVSIYENFLQSEQLELSKSKQDNNLPIYFRGNLLNNIINRDISELLTFVVSTDLPDGIEESDVVTNDDPFDKTRFLIEDGLKRKFRNLGEFYGRGFKLSDLKTITKPELNSIVDGEDL
jgi:outer membrane receptor for ferrienterochelin and colicin|tara:strand:- start:894 stop:1454 length:561 start_codon:yes stop_codon:yes gene_type:complete